MSDRPKPATAPCTWPITGCGMRWKASIAVQRAIMRRNVACAAPLRLRACGERPDVAARHEVLARAAHDDDAQRIVGRDVGGGVDQRVHQREVERVERSGRLSVSVATGPSRVITRGGGMVGVASNGEKSVGTRCPSALSNLPRGLHKRCYFDAVPFA